MQEFTGTEYLKIDLANNFGSGLDRTTWDTRLEWFDKNKFKLDDLVVKAEKKFLFAKAVEAYKKAQLGLPLGHIMYLDSTASGNQLMACLSGCMETARATNLINTGNREDLYTEVANKMNDMLPPEEHVIRSDVKTPVNKIAA